MTSPVLDVQPLGMPWRTPDPFLFCVHHDDAYPRGNAALGPQASLEGREMGMDFAGKDGWRMYHGSKVPGFPPHPHRGFETVTIVRHGFIDHADSLGAAARFGEGDTQWVTAGKGVVHSEMFPLLQREQENPLELFQIWLNLPRASKMTDPHFLMLWRETTPVHVATDEGGHATRVTVYAGNLADARPPAPPPGSWAADPRSELAIWTLELEPNARFMLPRASAGLNRTLYFFRGVSLRVADRALNEHGAIELRADEDVELRAGAEKVELLMLQGRPLQEPVVQHGPFVMNTAQEIEQAFRDYQSTRFGGWPWPSDEPTHGAEPRRFAKYPDGRTETK